jgi:transcription initiation factor TFIIB
MNERQQAALARLTDALDAPENVRELAHAVAHRAFAAELHMGRSVEGIAASAVYAAFRRDGEARTLDEIAAVADVNRTELGRSYKYFADELGIDLEPANPHEFVSRFAAPLAIGDWTETAAHEIIDETVEAGLYSGVSPDGIAAAALYLADSEHHDRLTQQDIADVAEVSKVTIRHRSNEQAKLLGYSDDSTIPPGRKRLFDSS